MYLNQKLLSIPGALNLSLLAGRLSGRLTLGGFVSSHISRHLGEEDTGMESSQTEACYKNKSAIKHKEARLILHDMVTPTTSHLCNSVFSRVS
jgi:hypothetical protein